MNATASILPPLPDHPVSHECMGAEQLARFLGVNRKTVYEYAARNVIPHRRLGRRIIFSREQVVSWLGACRGLTGTGK
jgi:excisionase family DNA binding protein